MKFCRVGQGSVHNQKGLMLSERLLRSACFLWCTQRFDHLRPKSINYSRDWLRCTALLLCWTVFSAPALCAEECKARPGSDFNLQPPFWCNIQVTVAVSENCTTQVEEKIHLPWSSGVIHRHIPKQENQIVQDVRAYIQSGERETDVHIGALPGSTPTSTIYNVRISATTEPVVVLLRYAVYPGILFFTKCGGIINFPIIEPPSGYSVMLSKWAVGGLSVAEIESMQVEFSLMKNTRMSYIDSNVKHPNQFSLSTHDTTNTSADFIETSITHSGRAAGLNPAHFVFYFRFSLTNGWAECPHVRSCRAETLQLKEEFEPGIAAGLVIGLAVGGGLAVLTIILVTWAVCCAISARRDEDAAEMNLPNSLHHFAYDTGDEASSSKWKSWMEGGPNSGKEEIRAIDLSPRNRDK